MVNGTGYLIGHIWEAIQSMGVKFHWDTYDNLGYPLTKFNSLLRGSFAKLWWTVMELATQQQSSKYS